MVDAYDRVNSPLLQLAEAEPRSASGEAVERTFQLYSTQIASIEVKRRGDVRRAKLYYLRSRSGKAARIKEKLVRKAVKVQAAE